MEKTIKNQSGFTMIELAIVITILGIIAIIAIPKYSGLAYKARETADIELGTLITRSMQKLLVSEDIKIDSINYGKIIIENTNHKSPLKYTSINIMDKNNNYIYDISLLMDNLINDSSYMQKASQIIITLHKNEGAPADINIQYIW
jgi:prepilin-type N-terminal cleavage/methylation domain